MRHPLWIVNSSLLAFLLIGLAFVFFTRQELPKRKATSQKKSSTTTPVKKVEAISLSKIYENDLFDTVKQPLPELHQPEHLQEAPQPPAPSQATIPADIVQPLLPPLLLTLKGIMIINDDSNNIAMIADNATSKEKNYKVGDMIQDAQIIKIFSSRVVFIRSNGQQESLYLTEKDIKKDALASQGKDNWSDVVYKNDAKSFNVDPEMFAEVIPNLALLIDMFDITTVYKDGKSVGCRMGDVDVNSLMAALGFEKYDVVTKVLNLPVTTLDERMRAYKEVTNLKKDAKCTVEVLRKNNPIVLEYTLTDLQDSLVKKLQKNTKSAAVNSEKIGILEGPTPEELEQQRIAMLKEKYQFAPTMQEIMLEQKKAMLHEGQEKRLHDYSFPDEAQL